jgi:hypothetical protein
MVRCRTTGGAAVQVRTLTSLITPAAAVISMETCTPARWQEACFEGFQPPCKACKYEIETSRRVSQECLSEMAPLNMPRSLPQPSWQMAFFHPLGWATRVG